MKKYNIAVIGGDGIGPEVIGEAITLLKATGIEFKFSYAEGGYGAYKKYKTPLPTETISICKKSDAILFGAVTTPPHIENYKSPIISLRKRFDLYANVRPFISLPIPPQRQDINIILFRENTEDLYTGEEYKIPGGAVAKRVITKKASKRIIQTAFEFAVKNKRKKVTVVHKANVLRLTDGLFLKIAQSLSKKYSHITYEEMLVDSCAMQLIKKPESFDVIVTTNMFGDILSDEIAALTGGLGVAASANIGKTQALFEPVHGSAPKYAGKNSANPLASFLSACLMLEYLGEIKTAIKIKKAINSSLQNKYMTKDLGGTTSMTDFTKKVIHYYNYP